jgi:benzoyl-CoA-dihydrodiol lyase
MDVPEDGGLRPGYPLKLNSYDLGVDIELADAIQRVRFEHPEVRALVVTSAKTASSAPARTSTCSGSRRTPSR